MQIPKYYYYRVKTDRKGLTFEIEDASDVDVAEVVRCKDCRFYEEGLRYDGSKCMVCGIYPFPMSHSPNDYCSHGERKGGDNP